MRLRRHVLLAWTWAVLVLVLVFTADQASAQNLVHVPEGADAVLPCAYPKGLPPSTVSIYWKDKRDNQVLTIRNYMIDPQNQSPTYQDRIQSFPSQYKAGNFSLVLKKVDMWDAGLFECHIMPIDLQQNVRLNVISKHGSGSSGSGRAWTGPLDGGSAVSPHLLLHLLLLLLLFCL